MNILGIIPARYASSRFPGKPLADIAGKSMIQRVYEQVKKAHKISDVVVATDDERILDHVKAFGGNALMTSSTHESGTDRCAEASAASTIGHDIVINIQGDEPLIDPRQIDELATCFEKTSTQIATLVHRAKEIGPLRSADTAKVVLDDQENALYFSRQPIPHLRGIPVDDWLNHHTYFLHVGIYGYRKEVLKELTLLPPSKLEKAESLEQLRWLSNGYRIQAQETEYSSIPVDRPEDVNEVLKCLRQP